MPRQHQVICAGDLSIGRPEQKRVCSPGARRDVRPTPMDYLILMRTVFAA